MGYARYQYYLELFMNRIPPQTSEIMYLVASVRLFDHPQLNRLTYDLDNSANVVKWLLIFKGHWEMCCFTPQ